MQNTISTTGDRVELLAPGRDMNNFISSIDNSSIEELQHMNAKLETSNDPMTHIKVAEDSIATPELTHPPQKGEEEES